MSGGIESMYEDEPRESISWDAVVIDMIERNRTGFKKYNRYLRPGVGDDMLQHAYEEALDLAVYLKTAILERDMK